MSKGRYTAERGKPRFFHASPRRFRHGDVIVAGHKGGYGLGDAASCVYLTNLPVPHGTILNKAIEEDWFVYQVDPLQPVEYNDDNREFHTRSAKIVRNVGKASVLAKKFMPGVKYNDYDKAFYSFPDRRPRRGVKTRGRRFR